MEQLPVIVTGTPTRFQMDFLDAVLGVENIVWAEYDKAYQVTELKFADQNRDSRLTECCLDIFNEIKFKCFKRFGLSEDRFERVLFSRSSQKRKSLVGVDSVFLEEWGLLDVDLTCMDFRSTVELLAKTEIFVYMVGASVFSLLFLNTQALAIEVNPLKDNSWARMFGLADTCIHKVVIANDLSESEDPWQGDRALDSNVLFSVSLRHEVEAQISHFLRGR
jgi:hypothetical protein